MIGSLCVPRFKNATMALSVGTTGFMIMSLLVAATLILGKSVTIVECSLFVLMLFLGLILPTSTTLALDMERDNSGSASAVLGFIMFLFGGILSPITGMGNMIYTTGIIIAGCSIATWFVNKTIKTT